MSTSSPPPSPSATTTPTPSSFHQVCKRFQFPPTTALAPQQLHILHSIHKHIPTINHMRRGFTTMSRAPTITTPTPTPTSTSATHPCLVWARTLSISLSNILIALCSFCVFREDKTGGDVDLLVEILEPVSVRLDAVAKSYQQLQMDPAVLNTQMYSFAVARAEAHLRTVMRVAGCWWEDAYFDSVGRKRRGVKGEVSAEAEIEGSEMEGSLPEGGIVKGERGENDEIVVKQESVVSDDRTIVEDSVVSDDRTVTASSVGAQTRGGSVWSAAEGTGSETTACEEHVQNASSAGSSAGGRRSASTTVSADNTQNVSRKRKYSTDRDTVSMPESSPEPDRDTDSFKTGGGETDRDTDSWRLGSAVPDGPSLETETEAEMEDDPWNDELFACTSSPVWFI
ncbi:hypothetical protein P167DRAFT_608439 [Morchella conica CCBAS932]|uniref:Uncharacterized protein n=1 Tax=Morchella conica CCBAS932 TaxID=1392247 RepID=A0A3N4KKI8_9PEZI|nr:hypothetical protein P167DRAFT_608439 [Morchella conica CCBAS932]